MNKINLIIKKITSESCLIINITNEFILTQYKNIIEEKSNINSIIFNHRSKN